MAGRVMHAAVVGASTLLGKELLEEISNSTAAAWDLKLLEEGEDIEGQLTSAGDEALVIHALGDTSFNGLDLVLFAGPAEITKQYLPRALAAGAAVVDLSGAAQGQPGIVLRSPWVEGSTRPDLTTTGMIVPHPASLMLALVAERAQRKFGTPQLVATVLEPASQAGSAGVDELHQQTVSLLSFQDVPKAVFGAQVAFNVQGSLGEEAQTSVAKTQARIENDLKQLLGATATSSVSLQLLQAPVFHGYVISAHLRLGAEVSAGELRSALAGGVVLAEEDTLPSNQAATESGDVLIRITGGESKSREHWLLLAADNLRLAARSALQAALELAALRPGTRVQ